MTRVGRESQRARAAEYVRLDGRESKRGAAVLLLFAILDALEEVIDNQRGP